MCRCETNEHVILCREVKVTESSESVLAGTKRPPFRLVVHAIREGGARLPIRPAVSEEFVVRESGTNFCTGSPRKQHDCNARKCFPKSKGMILRSH